jgi:hypothetical protein
MAQSETQLEDARPEHDAGSNSGSVLSPPPPPNPAADPKLQDLTSVESDKSSPRLEAEVYDIFDLPALTALKALSAGIEVLVNTTGDIPPTPPLKSPAIPHMRGMEAEKRSIVRSNSEKSLARLAQGSGSSTPRPARSPLQNPQTVPQPAQDPPAHASQDQSEPIDGVQLRSKPQPQAPPATEPESQPPLAPYIIIGEDSQALNLQHSAIIRKFYCRRPPPISITDYLLRIHQYCPMSTGVYLATSLYIHRLAVLEQAIVVTRRNAHRLLLGGLRVAMKALEDHYYKQSRISLVGGVSEKELSRLEVSFCFLTGFELAVTAGVLSRHWEMIRKGTSCWDVLDDATQEMISFHLGKPPGMSTNEQSARGDFR